MGQDGERRKTYSAAVSDGFKRNSTIYVCGRQRVVVDGEVSSRKSVLSGVPQRSVLDPILFLVYINDLEEGVTGSIFMFADDTKLFRKTKEIGDKQNLQDYIDKLVKWSENGRCYSILGNVNVYTHGQETLA